jgi:hypothetical protein
MEHDIGSGIGSRIKSFRRQRGLTAAALASRVGVTENAIRKLEAGDSREPRFSTGLRIARALDVDPQQIAGDAIAVSYLRTDEQSIVPDLATVIQRIREQRRALLKEGIEHAAVFGSVARGEATAASDVDIIVHPIPSARFSLFNLARVEEILRRALGRDVDVVTGRMAARPTLREATERDAVHAF